MATRAKVTNQRVAEDLGITHSAVSRIRSGERRPSIDLMKRVAGRFGWEVGDQVHSQQYATDFEAVLTSYYG